MPSVGTVDPAARGLALRLVRGRVAGVRLGQGSCRGGPSRSEASGPCRGPEGGTTAARASPSRRPSRLTMRQVGTTPPGHDRWLPAVYAAVDGRHP
jgi:hypothetical protein